MKDKSKANPDITKNLSRTIQQQKSGVHYLTPMQVLSVFLVLLLNIKTYLASFNYPE